MSSPTKRFHKARKKDGSINIDRRFRAFKGVTDPSRKKNKKISEMEIKDSELIETLDTLYEMEDVHEVFKFKKSKTVTNKDVDPKLKTKVLDKGRENAKKNLLSKAIAALHKLETNDKDGKTLGFRASEIHRGYGLDRNLDLSSREFLSKYKEIHESSGIRNKFKEMMRGTKDKDLEAMIDKMPVSKLKTWHGSISPRSAKRTLTPSELHQYDYATKLLADYDERKKAHRKDILDENAKVMDVIEAGMDKTSIVNGVMQKLGKSIDENCGREGEKKVSKKFKKETPGQ